MSRIACSNGHALTGNGQLHMPEPQLQLLRSDNTSTCPGGRVGCRERYALRPVKTRSREVKRERAIARVRCSAESARGPFYKEAPTVPAPRRAHECPMPSAGAVRCCCAFLRARLAPLTTAHRQGLEKLGKRGRGRGALPSLRLRAPRLARIACIRTRDAPTDICTVPQACRRWASTAIEDALACIIYIYICNVLYSHLYVIQ